MRSTKSKTRTSTEIKSKATLKNNLVKVGIFIGGVILTLIITNLWNKIFPEPTVIVREITDSLKVVHEYKIPLQSDSLEKNIENKLKNLLLLNNYDLEIEKRKKIIEDKSQSIQIPNLLLLNNPMTKEKGYIHGDSSPFFSLECPDINNSTYLDFKLYFFNPAILNEIAILKLEINKYIPEDSKYYVHGFLTEHYEIKPTNDNFIRIENNLPKGKFSIFIGFVLKKDLNAEFPTCYGKKFVRTKN